MKSYISFMSKIVNRKSFIWINLWKKFDIGFNDKENIIFRWSYKEVYTDFIDFYIKKIMRDLFYLMISSSSYNF